jgi:hypothetical protein
MAGKVVSCPRCGRRRAADTTLAGGLVVCAGCDTLFRVQEGEAAPEVPPATPRPRRRVRATAALRATAWSLHTVAATAVALWVLRSGDMGSLTGIAFLLKAMLVLGASYTVCRALDAITHTIEGR